MENRQRDSKPEATLEPPKTPISISDQLATKNLLTIMAVVLTAVLLLGGYFITFLSGKYIRQSNQIKGQDKTISYLKQKQSNLKILKVNMANINNKSQNGLSDADLILRAVPLSPDYKSLIATLEKISEASGVQLSTVSRGSSSGGSSAGSSPTKTGPTDLGFLISVSGPYDKIFTFLQNTENSARVLNFLSMSLSGDSANLTASISMHTYWQPEANIKDTVEALK